MNRLFVYGTLKKGCGNHDLVEPYCESIVEAAVAGYRKEYSGTLPYAVPSPEDRLEGELLVLRDMREILPMVDMLEGYYDDNELYIRKVVTVALADGSSVDAYMYVGGSIRESGGFNIGRNVSLNPNFNGALGFTKDDVCQMMAYYGLPAADSEQIAETMEEWYGNYRFSDLSETAIFNTDMVLYFLVHYLESGKPPAEMIDRNVRVDYGKLRHLVVLNRRLNGNFGRLEEIVESQGVEGAKIAESFPMERLLKPTNFISLLFYFGLLSHTGQSDLRIPNLTVKDLMYGYIREGYEDVDVFHVDFWRFANLIRDMAYEGEWRPVFRFLADEVESQTSIRDFLGGEKVVQTFLLAYLNVADYYITRSEAETAKGFADIWMEPFSAKYPDVGFRWLIEIKYAKRGKLSDGKREKLLADAKGQLEKYASDNRVANRGGGAVLKCLALVFDGWEMKAAEEFDFSGKRDGGTDIERNPFPERV